MNVLKGDISKLYDTIIKLEAKERFDSENMTEEEKLSLSYLYDLNSIYKVLSPSVPKDKVIACVVECKPNNMPKNYGFVYSGQSYFELENAFIKIILQEGITELWTDMSQGFAISVANAVVRMKKAGFNILLKCVIPYKGQSDQIYGASKAFYDNIIKNADEVHNISDDLNRTTTSLKNATTFMLNHSNQVYFANSDKSMKYFEKYADEKNITIKKFNIETLTVKEDGN